MVWDVLDGKRHRRGLGVDVEFFEKLGQVRVGDLIVNHEASIEREVLAIFLDCDGVGMSSNTAVFFKQRDVEMPMQEMRAGKT